MPSLNRRNFLKLSALTLGSLAMRSLETKSELFAPFEKRSDAIGLVRVAVKQMKIYKDPSYESEEAGIRTRDHLMYIYEQFESEDGPDFNPRWYRVEGGYAHTAYLQPVDTVLNPVKQSIPEEGQLFEITVPLTQSMLNDKWQGWQPLYRLYYQSMHWVTGLETGPNGKPWYKLKDDLLKINYYVPATHMRKVEPEELSPIAEEVPPEEKRVEVSIADQSLVAYEGDKVVLSTKISTGIPGIGNPDGTPSHTPKGRYNVQVKMPVRHMGNGEMTADPDAYEIPGVPWVSFFHETGVAFHGTYWHDNYGNEMSHGCVNMRPEEAKWLFRWVTPVSEPTDWEKKGRGTLVIVK